MHRILTSAAVLMLIAALLTGCTTNKEKLLPAETTMREIWNQQTGGLGNSSATARQLLDARSTLRRPFSSTEDPTASLDNHAYTRTAQNEIYRQFWRLPNPDLVMFVFAHLAGTDPVPVPGYTTVFPFYQRVQYALPGERTEDY
jgi:conjugative transfer region lipoprotein (TIGR03751 family)